MRRIGLGLFIAVILAGTAHAQKAKGAAAGVNCSYERCLNICQRGLSKSCSAFCEKEIRDRRVSGVCK